MTLYVTAQYRQHHLRHISLLAYPCSIFFRSTRYPAHRDWYRILLQLMQPFIEEFNHPMPEKCADGNTNVFVNGRELHERDLDLLASRGLPTETDIIYVIEIIGRVLDADSGEELEGLGKLAPTSNYNATRTIELEWENEYRDNNSEHPTLSIIYLSNRDYLIKTGENNFANLKVTVTHLGDHDDFRVEVDGISKNVNLMGYFKVYHLFLNQDLNRYIRGHELPALQKKNTPKMCHQTRAEHGRKLVRINSMLILYLIN
ncbi:hypothetical protein L2E82_47097 [Cichorium intybus]|uniref:Uncharacterized protein n=1 Tax=Cichorium intybus TaxID=13427 RepID=A0ACB8YVK4_CICIN|nr:hypothetical protein L2E82_47097 [Cichorium intybus]